jgi:F-type H+-transporting ATPase subunit c
MRTKLILVTATLLGGASWMLAAGAALASAGAAPAGGSDFGPALGAGIAIGLAALGGALGQGRAAAAALDGIARNPDASGKIFTPMIIALALSESLVLLAWLIASTLVHKIS